MQKTPVSIRIIYVLTSIVYYLSAVISGLGTLLAFVIFLGFINSDLQLHVDMPVEVNFKETGNTIFNGESTNIEIVEAIGKVHFIDTPPALASRLAIPLMIVFPAFFWLIFLFHRFIRNVREGRVFERRNYIVLRRLGFGLMGMWFIMVIYMQLFFYLLVTRFSFEQLEITANSRWFAGIFISGLFILVLSEVFIKGNQLEEENKLTI